MIYLYVKTHNITGLKYFGKTTRGNPHAYRGSGKYWQNHLNKYGVNVSTEIVGIFMCEQECVEFAIKFSKENDIVNSEKWANLIYENGLDGAPPGNIVSVVTRQKIRESLIGRTNLKSGYVMKETSEERSTRSRKISKDTIWINNGLKSKRSKTVIDGWVAGRIQKGNIGDKTLGQKNNGDNTRGKRIFNNGERHAYFFEGQQPEGWIPGKMIGFQGGTGTNKKGKIYGKKEI